MSAHRTRARLVRRVFPLLDAVGDDLHRRCCRVAQAGVTGDLTADAYALVAQHVAHAFQLDNDAVYFLYRSAGDAPDQRIPVFGGRDTGRVFVAQATDDFMDNLPRELARYRSVSGGSSRQALPHG